MTFDKEGLASPARGSMVSLAERMRINAEYLEKRGSAVMQAIAKDCADAAQALSALPDTRNELVAELRTLISEYWDEAFDEGAEGRKTDTHDGKAQQTWSAIDARLAQVDSLIARAQAAEASLASARADALEEAAKLIESGFDREGITTKHDKCPHGLYGWEDCEQCAVIAIRALNKDSSHG